MSEKHVIVSYSHVWEIVSKNSINFPWGPLSGLLIWNLKSNTISKSQSQEQNGTVTSFLTPPQQEINNRQRHNKYREEQRYPGPRKKSLKFPLPGLYPFYELPLRGPGIFQSLSINYKLLFHTYHVAEPCQWKMQVSYSPVQRNAEQVTFSFPIGIWKVWGEINFLVLLGFELRTCTW
jgi:hypothetical protein